MTETITARARATLFLKLCLLAYVLAAIACSSEAPPALDEPSGHPIGESTQALSQNWKSFCSGGQCLTAVPPRSGGLQAGQAVLGMDPTSPNFSGSMVIINTDGSPTGYHQQLAASGNQTLCLGVDTTGGVGPGSLAVLQPCGPTGEGTAGTILGLQFDLVYNWGYNLCLDTNGITGGSTGEQPTWNTCPTNINPPSQLWFGFGYQTWGVFIEETAPSNLCCGSGTPPINYWLDTASFCCQSGKVETGAAVGACPCANTGQQPTSTEGGFLVFYDTSSPGSALISQVAYGSYSGVFQYLTNNGSGLPTFAGATGDDTQRWIISRGLFPAGIDSYVSSKSSPSLHWTWNAFSSGGQHAVALSSGSTNASMLEFRFE